MKKLLLKSLNKFERLLDGAWNCCDLSTEEHTEILKNLTEIKRILKG